MKKLVALVVLAASASPIWAATQSVTLSVPDMNCAACPITVKKALTNVSGVKPKPGDCCVYCSYGTVPCPPIQERGKGSACCG